MYSSVSGAERSEGVTHFHTKYVIEQHIREFGGPASIVRPVFFMENLLTFEHPQLHNDVALFRIPLHPTTKRQMIAADNIGIVVADMFDNSDKFIGQALEIAGDELTGPQIAEIYTKVTGQPARFEEQPIGEVRAFNREFAAMFEWLNEQGFKADIAACRRTYPELSSFETWLERNRAAITLINNQGGAE